MSSGAVAKLPGVLSEADAELRAGRPEAAEALYRAILRDDPSNAQAQRALHKLRKGAKKPGKGRGKKAKHKKRRATEIENLGDIQAVHLLSSAGRREEAEERAQQLIDNALALCSSKKWHEAEAEARRLLTGFPRSHVLQNILGLSLYGQNRLKEAVLAYRQAVRTKPDYAPAHSNLGRALLGLGDMAAAVASLEEAVRLLPDHTDIQANLGFALTRAGRTSEAIPPLLKSLELDPDSSLALTIFGESIRFVNKVEISEQLIAVLVRCFRDPRIDSGALNPASEAILHIGMDSLSGRLDGHAGILELDRFVHGLLQAQLSCSRITSSRLETMLVAGRRDLLMRRFGPDGPAQPPQVEALLGTLACQGFLNEYVWQIASDEHGLLDQLEEDLCRCLDGGGEVALADIYLLGAYRPLHRIAALRAWALAGPALENEAAAIIKRLILDPVREAEIAVGVEALTGIDDQVSVSVRDMYEENPYPRWDSLLVGRPVPYTEQVLKEIAPHCPDLGQPAESPDILIAGCGTGKQPISSATIFSGARVLAVDLSRASIAFAIRKAEEMGIDNIRFAQADILKLGALEERFDLIECGGVLHHMADPEAGLKVLLGLLKPGGLLKLGLYSEYARRGIVRMRETIADLGFPATLQGIRDFRVHVFDNKEDLQLSAQRLSGDFYSTSTVRDLCFHVQEHRFTLPQIKALLARHKLAFLGFTLLNYKVKIDYQAMFPEDVNCVDLDNWDRFEKDHPRTFAAMYQFWCRRLSD